MVDVITLAHSLTWTRILDKGQRPRWLLRNVEASLESIREAGVQSEVDGKALRAACPSVVSTGCCTRTFGCRISSLARSASERGQSWLNMFAMKCVK